MPRRDEPGVLPSAHGDLRIAQTTSANVLVVGPERLVVNLVSVLLPEMNPDAMIRCRGGRLTLPASPRGGLVVLRDVDALSADDQRKLREWLDAGRAGRRVVSTAAAPLLPLVESGAFDDALYYRLNTVYVDLT